MSSGSSAFRPLFGVESLLHTRRSHFPALAITVHFKTTRVTSISETCWTSQVQNKMHVRLCTLFALHSIVTSLVAVAVPSAVLSPHNASHKHPLKQNKKFPEKPVPIREGRRENKRVLTQTASWYHTYIYPWTFHLTPNTLHRRLRPSSTRFNDDSVSDNMARRASVPITEGRNIVRSDRRRNETLMPSWASRSSLGLPSSRRPSWEQWSFGRPVVR